jgi:phosphoribosylaminoimidazole carboxylase PurE protein
MEQPIVSIIMGSDSDLPVMQPAADILDQFNVPYELTIVSAHRTPDRLFEFSKQAHERGIRVIVAGAGGAAHLPGMVASLSPLPVIGVPVIRSMAGIPFFRYCRCPEAFQLQRLHSMAPRTPDCSRFKFYLRPMIPFVKTI